MSIYRHRQTSDTDIHRQSTVPRLNDVLILQHKFFLYSERNVYIKPLELYRKKKSDNLKYD